MITHFKLEMRKSLIQVCGFLISTLGWVFISCTTAMDYWKVVYVGGKGGNWMIKASWYWSNLWRDCVTDTTSVTSCRDYDILWAVTPYVQGVRGLLMIGMTLGFVGAILCFIGMDCTYIGGREKAKDKTLLAGAMFHLVGGLSACAAYCLYTSKVISVAFAPTADRSIIRYGIGTPIFLGFIGSFLTILGSILYAVTVISKRMTSAFTKRSKTGHKSSKRLYSSVHYTPSRDLSRSSASHISKISNGKNGEKISAKDTFV
nr:claudin-10 [Misgurnus anguillicaudatus]